MFKGLRLGGQDVGMMLRFERLRFVDRLDCGVVMVDVLFPVKDSCHNLMLVLRDCFVVHRRENFLVDTGDECSSACFWTRLQVEHKRGIMTSVSGPIKLSAEARCNYLEMICVT